MKKTFNDYMNILQEKMNQAAYDKKTPTYGTAEISDVHYLEDENPNHVLDVYAPGLDTGALPVIVTIHGGGYVSNRKVCNRPHGMWLASQGFKVVNVEYTLYPQATLGQALEEITAAFHWIEANAEEYGFDLDNLFLVGDSSGGHLALLMAALQDNQGLQAATGIAPVSSGIRAVEATCPVGTFYHKDFISIAFKKLFTFLGKEDWKSVEPFALENAITPHFMDCLLITTPTDTGIHTVTERIHLIMTDRGVEHDYLNLEGTEHKLPHVFNVLNPDWTESQTANTVLVDFFREHMA